MGMKLKRYKEYKDSGVEWLGEIPKGWEVKPGFTVIKERLEKNIGLKEKQVLSLSYGRIIIKTEDKLTGLVPESFETYQIVYPNDIIIRPTDLQNDKVSLRTGFSNHRGIITSAYINLRVEKDYYPYYIYLFLHTLDITKIIYGLGSGLRQNLSFLDLKRFPFLLPPLSEQKQIADYLDQKTAQIDKAIAQKEQIIELLKERKQILINKAVTRGLNPHAPLKDSGIDWIGKIPEHWEARRLKNTVKMIVSNVDKHIKKTEEQIRLCNYVDVYKNDVIVEEIPFMVASATEDEIKRYKISINDVIITKDSEDWRDIGIPAWVKYEADDLICGYHLAILRPQHKLFSGYLFRLLQSINVKTQFSVKANGVTRCGLSHNAILDSWIILPPLSEQKQISGYLEEKCTKITTAITQKHLEIEKLKEYKATLIDSAVTGKICLTDN